MRATLIPFGEAGWKAKRLSLEQAMAARPGPPFLYGDILVIVPSARLRRTYGRAVLEAAEQAAGTRAVSPPHIQTLHQFLQRLGERHVRRKLIDENSRLFAIEGIVKEALARTPSLGIAEVLAPSLSTAVADMIEELSSAGVTPARLSAVTADAGLNDKVQVRLLEASYARYVQVLEEKGLVDPAGILAALAERFEPSWTAPYRTIIVGGLHDATELQVRVLRRMAAAGTVLFQIDAPSTDALRLSGEHHPLRLAREFAAKLGLMVGESAAPSDGDSLFLAEVLFSERSFADAARLAPSPFRREIRLDSAVNVREEVSHIARQVKRSLRQGNAPEGLLVSFSSLDEYGPLVEEIFTHYGIPYNRALGRQLSTSAVTTSLLSLLQAVQDGFSGASLLQVLSAPFLKFGDEPALGPALDRLLRKGRITGGRAQILSALERHAPDEEDIDVLRGRLTDLFAALEPFASREPAPLSRWMERLAGLLHWSGLTERVMLIKGPLNINMQAYVRLETTILSLRQAGELFPEYRHSFTEWLFLLKKTFMHARFQVPPDDEGGVQVLGLEESIGQGWSEIYFGGLVDGKFPQRLPQNIFLPEASLEMLGVRTLEKARLGAAYHFYRLLLSAPRVVLTWPEYAGDKPFVPSPFLTELTPLREANLLRPESGIHFSLAIDDAQSVPELAKAIAWNGAPPGLAAVLEDEQPGIEAIGAALAGRPAQPAGRSPSPAQRVFQVTELDAYLRCPYDYYVRNILGIEPIEEVTEDLSPLDRGTRVHSILRDFYRSWNSAVTRENRSEARTFLSELADRAYDRDADTFRNRREKTLFLEVMIERFLDAEVALWDQGFRPAYLEQKIDAFGLKLADGSAVEIHAKIDRIDVDASGNFIIVDYKTGKYPRPTKDREQEIFQLPVYAVMAREAFAGKEPALKRPVGLAYYDLSGRFGEQARDVVLFDREIRDDHPATKPQTSPRSSAGFEEILADSMEKARRAVEGILRRAFPSLPQDRSRCRNCPNEMMCTIERP